MRHFSFSEDFIEGSARCYRAEEVVGNRDLLQRVFRLVLGGKGDSSGVVPLHFQHAHNWGQLLLVNHFWKVRSNNLTMTSHSLETLLEGVNPHSTCMSTCI